MDINNNLKLLNTIIAYNRLSVKDKLRIIEIAKVSQDSNDLIDNLMWELNINLKYLQIKKILKIK